MKHKKLPLGALAIASICSTSALAAPCAGFVDVDASNPFCPNVAWLKARAITMGCGPSTYCPDDAVSRLSIAAFLNRLGDALVPPNVLIVANVGGTFHSIQAAIDFAKLSASAQTPFLVKVAPGVYQEKILLADYVDVEGSGRDTTIVISDGATVRTAGKSELRNIGIRSTGEALGPFEGAITQRDTDFTYSQTSFRHIAVKTTTPASFPLLSSFGVVVASGTASFRDCSIEVVSAGTQASIQGSGALSGFAVDIQDCVLRASTPNQAGVNHLTGAALGEGSALRNSRVYVDAVAGGATGIYVGSGTVPITATTVEVNGTNSIGLGASNSVALAVKASSISVSGPGQNIAVYNSSTGNSSILGSTLSAPLAANSFSVQSAAGGFASTIKIVGSVLTGTPDGAICVASIDQAGTPIASCM